MEKVKKEATGNWRKEDRSKRKSGGQLEEKDLEQKEGE